MIDVKQLISKIDFTEETLAQAHLEQAGLLFAASEYRIQKLRDRLRVDAACSEAETSAAMKLRRTSEEKLTEAAIKEVVSASKDVVIARRNADEAKVMDEFAKILVDAFHERGSMIKSLVNLVGASAASESRFIQAELERMGLSRIKENIRKRYPGARA